MYAPRQSRDISRPMTRNQVCDMSRDWSRVVECADSDPGLDDPWVPSNVAARRGPNGRGSLSLSLYNMFMRRLHDIAYIYVHICTKWPRLSLYIYMIYSSVSLYDMTCTYTCTKWPRLSLSICTKSILLLYNVYHIMNTLSIMYITYVSIIYNAYYIMYTSYIMYIPCISYNVYILYNVYTMHII